MGDAVAAGFEDLIERGVVAALMRWLALTFTMQAAVMLLFSSIAA